MTTKKKTFDQLMQELTPEEIAAFTPPTGRYIPAALRKAVYERDGSPAFTGLFRLFLAECCFPVPSRSAAHRPAHPPR